MVFIDYYNNQRYHESLRKITPADVYFSMDKELFNRRNKIKTLIKRRKINRNINKSE